MLRSNTRWIICERRPDGSEGYYTEEARGALSKLYAGWGCGWAFMCKESARLALAWLSVAYHIEDTENRNSENIKLIFDSRGVKGSDTSVYVLLYMLDRGESEVTGSAAVCAAEYAADLV